MEAITRLTRNLRMLYLQRLQSKMWYEKQNFYLTTKKKLVLDHTTITFFQLLWLFCCNVKGVKPGTELFLTAYKITITLKEI